MNKHFQISITNTSDLAGWVAVLAGIFLVCIPAYAQQSGDNSQAQADDNEIGELRFEDSIQTRDGDDEIDVRLFRRIGDTRPIWHVAAYSGEEPEELICRSTLPREAGRSYYEYHLESLAVDDGNYLVMLEAEPTDADPVTDPPVFQIAFQISDRDGRIPFNCSMIGRGEHTELDGGPQMAIEQIEGQQHLVRHDELDELEFCGIRDPEKQGYERFDPSVGRFITTGSIDIDRDYSVQLDATVPDEKVTPPLTEDYYSWLSASSDIRGAPAGASVPRPLMLGELDPSQPWIEGDDELGVGEFVTARVSPAAPVRGLRIFPGHGQSEQTHRGYARPTRLMLSFDDGERFVVDLPAVSFDQLHRSGGLFVHLPEPRTTSCISVMIVDADSGEFAGETTEERRRLGQSVAIGEITPYSMLDGPNETQTAERIVRAIGREPSPRTRDELAALGDLVSTAMITAIAEILEGDFDDKIRARLVPLLGEFDPERTLPVLERHYRRVAVDEADYRYTKRAMARHGSLAAPGLLDVLDELDDEHRKYVDAVRIIGRIGSDVHLRRLIPRLGEGDSMVRSERIRAVAHGGAAMAPALISAARTAIDTPAGLDALTALVSIGRRHFRDDRAQIEQADELAAIFESSDSRAHRIRTIEAMGFFELSDDDELLAQTLLHDHPDPVIRTFAAEALKRAPGDEVRHRLEEALRDRSPDVRIAAVRTLAKRSDGHEATPAVIDYVTSDHAWPQGLHHGLDLLARSPDDRAVEAIGQLVEQDITAPATRIALRALRRAERTLQPSQIEQHLTDDTAPPAVLEQLVAMLGFADADASVQLLIPIAERNWKPLADRPAELLDRLARSAFMSLGKTRSSRSLSYLLDVITNPERSDADRSHALRGLGFFDAPHVVDDLQRIAAEIPDRLRDDFRRTLTMIRNRLAVQDAIDDVEYLIDRLDEANRQQGEPFDELPRPH